MERMDNQECENDQEGRPVPVQHVIKNDHVRIEIWGEYPNFSISRWEFQVDVLFVQPHRRQGGARFLSEFLRALLEAESWMSAWAGDKRLIVAWMLFAPVTEERLLR
jgi:hypothetical protein